VFTSVVLFKDQAFYVKINIRFQHFLALVLLFFCPLLSFQLAFEKGPPIASFTSTNCIVSALFPITATNLNNVAPAELNEKSF
jgi:hypothetical protein